MSTNFIHDRGRGPELTGTRITVYDLLPYFLDATATEDYICQVHELQPVQVAAARAYVLHHADTVLAEHLKIEQRLAAGNPPEVRERAQQTHDSFIRFQEWLRQRQLPERDQTDPQLGINGAGHLATFREWLADREQGVRSADTCS